MKEALKLALEALEWTLPLIEDFGNKEQLNKQHKAIASLYEAQAQPAQKTATGIQYAQGIPFFIPPAAQPAQEPVAWRTFDGEGGYEYRTYDNNEDYANDWEKRNPNHKGWVEPLYKDPTPCQTCQALARTVMMDQTAHDTIPQQRPWQGLTPEEMKHLYPYGRSVWGKETYEAIEKALKERNHG
jgi:hypothetical protein